MAQYTQAHRAISIETPLGKDALLLEKLFGVEALSQPYRFELELLAEQAIDFNRLLGQKVTVKLALPNQSGRSIHGIIQRLSRGERVPAADGKALLTRYQAELTPELWLLSRRVQSRIFQGLTVPDMLRQVLHGDWGLEVFWRLTGKYAPRNYCVQYRESDLAFVSRLMEAEGICYFFEHDEKHARLVVSDSPTGHTELPKFADVAYEEAEGGPRHEPRLRRWQKSQQLCACKHTLWDYHFQLPDSDLKASAEIAEQAEVGAAAHRLNHQHSVNGQDLLGEFEYPGGFAPAFDGISKEGGDQAVELKKIFQDNQRLARIRAEEEAANALSVHGSGDAGQLLPGYLFTLERHFEDNGKYLLTRVEHHASLEGVYTTNPSAQPVYENRFECLPAGLPFRPRRTTPRPHVTGPQTAVVVGPSGQEIYLDKYGRVKVKFPWDLQNASAADRSCWVRVAQFWAGKTWGAFFWPRVGHEVVVAFEHGDPDRPLIVGSVYNDANMPPLELPTNAQRAGIKSCIFGGDPTTQFNAIVFNDPAGEENLQLHSEKSAVDNSESNRYQYAPKAQFTFHGSF
jgi:type VI secretion system secreted protein VgrG